MSEFLGDFFDAAVLILPPFALLAWAVGHADAAGLSVAAVAAVVARAAWAVARRWMSIQSSRKRRT